MALTITPSTYILQGQNLLNKSYHLYLGVTIYTVEYAAVAWDPHQRNNIQTLEKSNVELPVG